MFIDHHPQEKPTVIGNVRGPFSKFIRLLRNMVRKYCGFLSNKPFIQLFFSLSSFASVSSSLQNFKIFEVSIKFCSKPITFAA